LGNKNDILTAFCSNGKMERRPTAMSDIAPANFAKVGLEQRPRVQAQSVFQPQNSPTATGGYHSRQQPQTSPVAKQPSFAPQVILVHGPGCPDGVLAAWAFWRALSPETKMVMSGAGGLFSNNAETIWPHSIRNAMQIIDLYPMVFVFMQPGKIVPIELVQNRNVLILDLDLGEQLIGIVNAAKFTFLIDHHSSTNQTIQRFNLLEDQKFGLIYDSSPQESAATLAWRYFHQASVPEIVNLVRIVDTGSLDEDEHAPGFVRSLVNGGYTKQFAMLDQLLLRWKPETKIAMADQSSVVIAAQRQLFEEVAKQAALGVIFANGKRYNMLYVQSSIAIAPIAHRIRKTHSGKYAKMKIPIHFVGVWNYQASNQGHPVVTVSLRDPLEGINLSEITKSLGGGGHDAAASFSFPDIAQFHNYIMPYRPIVCQGPYPSQAPTRSNLSYNPHSEQSVNNVWPNPVTYHGHL